MWRYSDWGGEEVTAYVIYWQQAAPSVLAGCGVFCGNALHVFMSGRKIFA